jgi:copper chaperone NosL
MKRVLCIGAVLTFAASAIALAPACKRPAPADRCERCGMKLEPSRASWSAELVTADGATHHYDTPRCALQARRDLGASGTKLRVHEYYGSSSPPSLSSPQAQMRDANDVVFVLGSDVDGPMGPDFVPVDPTKAKKFIADHAATRALPLTEITPRVLEELR